MAKETQEFISIYPFDSDESKPGRILETAKIGDVYMTRVSVMPGVITGGYYHKETDIVFYASRGVVQVMFEQVVSGERKNFIINPQRQVVQIPPYNKVTTKNVGEECAMFFTFSNKPLRSEDDSYVHTPKEGGSKRGIGIFTFEDDNEHEGRTLSTVKVGPVYISKLIIEPGVTLGEYYHDDTDIMFYVGAGRVHCVFEHSESKERKELVLDGKAEAVQMPRLVAASMSNDGEEPAEVVLFSNRRLNTGDEVEYKLS